MYCSLSLFDSLVAAARRYASVRSPAHSPIRNQQERCLQDATIPRPLPSCS